MNADSFRGKTVVITGASAGVGAACARAFAAQKAKLVLIARGEEKLGAIAEELRAETEVLAISMDVADTESCLKLFERAEQVFGAIDCLINNAGTHRRGNVESRSPEDLAAMVDVNLRAPLVLTAAALPYFRKAAADSSRG